MSRAATIAFSMGILLATSPAFAADGALQGRGADGGLGLRWLYTPDRDRAGLGTLDVFVSDMASGAPVQYERGALLGWLQRDRGELVEQDKSCADRIKALATQGIGRRSDIDLNQYRIVTLNADGSVAFINPFVGFNNAKLESIVELKAKPLDWVQIKERMEMWVLLSAPARLVAIDLQAAAVTRSIDLPEGGNARRVVFDAANRRLWVGLPGAGELAAVDLDGRGGALTLIDAPGLTDVLATPDGGVLAWTDRQNVARLITGPNGGLAVALSGPARAIAHSDQAKEVAIGSVDGKLLLVPDGGQGNAARTSIALSHPVEAMQLFDLGRRLAAVGGGRASIVDLALGRVVMELATPAGADRIVASDQFLYVTGGPSGRATLYALADLAHARNQALDVMVSSPATSAEDGNAPSKVAASPQGNGILVASPDDGMIYQYSEGMMAPVGSYSNYRRAAVGLDIVDYSFREIEPGHYRSTIRNEAGGRYELLIGAAGPRMANCTSLVLEGKDNDEAALPRLHAEYLSGGPTGDGRETLRVRILETLPGQQPGALPGLKDLTLLAFDKHSGWQRRVLLKDLGNGEYAASLPVPRSATYDLLVSSRSANLSFVEGHMGEQRLGPAPCGSGRHAFYRLRLSSLLRAARR